MEKITVSKRIITSDRFCELSWAAQALYFHSLMHAEASGEICCVKNIARSLELEEYEIKEAIRELVDSCFIEEFGDGNYLIYDHEEHFGGD